MNLILSLLNWDRVLGALLGGGIAWCTLMVINQTIWIPNAEEKGRQEVRAEMIERAMELVKERSRTNADVQKLDDRSACIELGGLFEDGACR